MNNSTKLKIVVIGGAGFIGRALVDRLCAEGHDVLIADTQKPPVASAHWVEADVRDRAQLAKAMQGRDVIYNLAAEHRDDVRPVSLYDAVNVRGAENVCAVAAELGINRIIFTSSVAVYGMNKGTPDEAAPFAPFNAYGRTKAEAEGVFQRWTQAMPARKLTIVRPTVVFGPDNRGNVYNLLRQVHSGRFMMIGKGENRKSLAYVGNVAAFLAFVLEGQEASAEVYNYVDKPDFKMKDMIQLIYDELKPGTQSRFYLPYTVGCTIGQGFDLLARFTSRRFPVSNQRIQKFCAETTFSADKVTKSGFRPPYDFAEALRQTIRHEFLGEAFVLVEQESAMQKNVAV